MVLKQGQIGQSEEWTQEGKFIEMAKNAVIRTNRIVMHYYENSKRR